MGCGPARPSTACSGTPRRSPSHSPLHAPWTCIAVVIPRDSDRWTEPLAYATARRVRVCAVVPKSAGGQPVDEHPRRWGSRAADRASPVDKPVDDPPGRPLLRPVACTVPVHPLWTGESFGCCLRCGPVRPTSGPREGARAAHDREILRLAVPAFGALVAEPLFLLADSAIVGHLGHPAAGRARRRRRAARDRRSRSASSWPTAPPPPWPAGSAPATCARAIAQGVDGVWLAARPRLPARRGAGGGRRAAGGRVRHVRRRDAVRPDLPAGVGPRPAGDAGRARRHGSAARAAGHPVTPLVVAAARRRREHRAEPRARLRPPASASPARRSARCSPRPAWPPPSWPSWSAAPGASDAPLRPDLPGIRAAAPRRRTARRPDPDAARGPAARRPTSPRAAGTVAVAAHQVAFTIWLFLSLMLDAVAIAGQAIVGRYLGAGRRRRHPGGHPADGRVGRRRRRRAGGRPARAASRVRAAVHRGPGGARRCSAACWSWRPWPSRSAGSCSPWTAC